MSGANKRVVPLVPSGGIVGKKATMKRLKGFDYKKPYFYMVTLKRLAGLLAFSQITEEAEPPKDAKGRPCYLIANEITRALASVIIGFAAKWRGLAPIDCFVIMPDHIHLLMRILDTGDQLPLGSYVHQFMRALAFEYWRVTQHSYSHRSFSLLNPLLLVVDVPGTASAQRRDVTREDNDIRARGVQSLKVSMQV